MSDAPQKNRDAVTERCYGVCEFPGCFNRCDHIHHRLPRRFGRHDVELLMGLCLKHHDYVHAHPAESYDRGWLVHSWDVA